MKPVPYVGVSGFMSANEVRAALDAFPACGRQLMVGVLASAKTLAGQRNRYPLRYPARGDIANVFVDDPRALNLVHYASDEPPSIAALTRLAGAAGGRCHGFQFNCAWPEPADLEKLHRLWEDSRGAGMRVVLQARPGGCPHGDWMPHPALYRSLVTDILVDASGGRGVRLDPGLARAIVDDVQIRWAQFSRAFRVGIAGGLCAETLPAVAALVRRGVNIDAEGRLRDDADGGGNLDIERVRAYLRAAAEACNG